MDLENTALPTGAAATAAAAAGEQAQQTLAAAEQNLEQPGAQEGAANDGGKAEGEAKDGEQAKKPEKTAEQREIDRLRRRVDNLTRQKYELRAAVPQGQGQQQSQGTQGADDEPVTLTRAELERQIEERAAQRAPSIAEQQAEIQRRQGVVKTLEKEWGKEEFDAKAQDLADVFGGLVDRSGRPTPATDAIFDSENPKAVIEYLTDPDNADEAERIAKLPATRAGREIARIEAKLEAAKKDAKPKPSNAAKPLEPVKGGGAISGQPDPTNTKAWIRWANEQERAARH